MKSASQRNKNDQSLIGLDFLRFILSLSVIIWHYQHFYYPSGIGRTIYVVQQPFFRYLSFFYLHGNQAVPIFWIISGLIFFKFYSKDIVNGDVGLMKFFINRFSRLYPLHFFALLIVILLQLGYTSIYHESFVYENFNLKYFLLNFFLLQNWFSDALTFNGPEWSVSIELFVYVAFFFFCRTRIINNSLLLILMILTFLISDILKFNVFYFNQCFYCFLSGCLLSKILDNVKCLTCKAFLKKNALPIFLLVVGIFCIKLFLHSIKHAYLDTPEVVSFMRLCNTIFYRVLWLALFILIIFLSILLFNLKLLKEIKVITSMGNLTYSMYLIHFPIQLIIYLIIKPNSFITFNSEYVFILYILSTIALGYISYNYLERPIQGKLRSFFNSK